MSAGLAAFLAARYDEAEATHRYAGEGRIAWLTYQLDNGDLSHTTVAADHHDGYWCAGGKLLPEPASVLVVYDNAQALADIKLKRAILAGHARVPSYTPEVIARDSPYVPGIADMATCARCHEYNPGTDGAWWDALPWPCATVRQLGTEFAEHPEYKPEWGPE